MIAKASLEFWGLKIFNIEYYYVLFNVHHTFRRFVFLRGKAGIAAAAADDDPDVEIPVVETLVGP